MISKKVKQGRVGVSRNTHGNVVLVQVTNVEQARASLEIEDAIELAYDILVQVEKLQEEKK